ncbi:ATP-binding protein [Agarivorans sp. QJM3NY_33]|uniref:ATP-binding protein n=1 Tax=Agarivorans sp. QJM3NY_33 TaxID=3421432 RepID=UPI003D7EAA34
MLSSVSFQTRARTIDHLGREQIADCPTAISELWKNAYDAYARNVCLNIFDGAIPVATLVDDGHGMSLKDLKDKWLTVGTESKAIASETPLEERNGIKRTRVKQGQKGIGRLSCAALGSLLLLVSKKKGHPFVACLLDWRLFENPFLMLHDIKIPTTTFSVKSELADLLPDMLDSLMGNLWGDKEDKARDERVIQAWELFHQQELTEQESNKEDQSAQQTPKTTKERIENTVIDTYFSERHFNTWQAWQNNTDQGTAMFMADISDDLKDQLTADASSEAEGTEVRSKERLIQTLSSFVNPLSNNEDLQITDFSTSVIAWNGNLQRFIVDEVRNFNMERFNDLEHIIKGSVDETGLFTGDIKAFGEWHKDITIKPKARYKMRKDTQFGPFNIQIGTFEVTKRNTTLSEDNYNYFDHQRSLFGGCMVYRDELRVMPYGREDNDFFEMEKRRSKNAGLYVFTNRACFGGMQLSKAANPNLKDKAGREGIIDNKASKLFREVVEHILIEVAKRFIGRASDIRKDKLEEIHADYDAEKAAKNRKKLLKKEQTRVKDSISKNSTKLRINHDEITELAEVLVRKAHFENQDELTSLQHHANKLEGELNGFSLSPIPKTLGSIEQSYRDYRDIELAAKGLLKQINGSIASAQDKLVDKQDIDIAEKNFRSRASILHHKIRKLASEGKALINSQLIEFENQVDIANKAFHSNLATHLDDLAAGRTELDKVTALIELEYEKQNREADTRLKPYITAMQSLSEQIDLQGLAIQSVNESSALRKELGKLHSLAQLGISVEIIGHEIEGIDMTIERGLKELATTRLDNKAEKTLDTITHAHQALSDSWRFLSPLKLSGEKVRTHLTGKDIYKYIEEFFGERLKKNNIKLQASDTFKTLSIFEQPSKIYPVFINLINNARYWVKQTDESERLIKLDLKEGLVFVSDNGPGVDIDDINELFTIFFTKKQRGGRGVGLYLCRVNLAAGGHKIYYSQPQKKLLSGANFIIEFRGLKNA